MWSLRQKAATLDHLNTRTEKFGDEDKLAVDLKIGMTVPNTYLDEVSPGLRSALYGRANEKDLLDTADHLPRLLFSLLAPLSWEYEWTNCRLTLHYGVRADGDLVLEDVAINKLTLAPKDGGSVDVRFRAQFYPDLESHPEIMGKLAMMLEGKSITITLEQRAPEEPEESGVIDGTQGPGTSSNPAFDETNEAEGDTEAPANAKPTLSHGETMAKVRAGLTEAAEPETTPAPKARRSRRATVEAE